MRALFFGTPAIAVPSLEALASIADVVGVVCQPDRPAGRGLELKAPPVKVKAGELGLPVVQPEKIRTPEFAAWVKDAAADVALVIAYGRILPKAVLDAPRRGCMNLHASILPRYRGAAPITWAIAGGEAETGVSLMQMDEGMDTGPVYAIHRIPIGPDTTADELAVDLGALAARVVREDLRRAVDGELEATPQDHEAATHAALLKKEDGRIRWDRSARQIHDHIRGMTSWPGAFTTIEGKALKVLAARVEREAEPGGAPPGTVVMASRNVVIVACGEGAIQLLRAQAEGRKPLAAADLVAGRTLQTGMVLGR
ncbi:methionyl-tRNA formyltransferase [Sorangium sp. So ce834]|uniref:methionyl-tRNA formyltransferase n=1 Tax=Sorangium sp. So ce834 TaxID=3133321 RepID=UPI003F61A794